MRLLKRLLCISSPAQKTPEINVHEEMLKIVTKQEDSIYNKIVAELRDNAGIHKYGAEYRLLQRRISRYERMRGHASLYDQEAALNKLDKQWKRFKRPHPQPLSKGEGRGRGKILSKSRASTSLS